MTATTTHQTRRHGDWRRHRRRDAETPVCIVGTQETVAEAEERWLDDGGRAAAPRRRVGLARQRA